MYKWTRHMTFKPQTTEQDSSSKGQSLATYAWLRHINTQRDFHKAQTINCNFQSLYYKITVITFKHLFALGESDRLNLWQCVVYYTCKNWGLTQNIKCQESFRADLGSIPEIPVSLLSIYRGESIILHVKIHLNNLGIK